MGKKSLIKSTSKKKTGSTDPAPEKTAETAAQSAKPVKEKPVKRKTATAKKAAPKKAATKKSAAKPASKKKAPATVKKAAPKKAAAKKSTTKPTAKKKAPATAKKTTPKKAAAKTDAAKPVVKDKAPATAKETAPQEATAKVEAVKPDVKKEAPPIATTGADAAKPAVKKATPPVEAKTTSAPKPSTPKVAADAPKPKAVEAPPTTTAPAPKKEAPPLEKTTPATPPVQAAAAQDAVKESASKPAAPSAKEPQFTQPPDRPEPSPEEQVQVSYDKPLTPEKPAAEPMNPIIKYGAIGLAFLIFLVLGASVTNSKRYYIKKRPLDIEISKGEFSPIGKKQLLKISGVAMPETAKATYNRNDVYPMIFQYYLNHADALLENSEAPDYDAIKVLINKAQGYAVTPTLAGQATRRVTAIDLHHLFYKASVTAEKGTIAGFDEGLDFLAKAKKLSLDESQLAMVDHKIAEMKDARARIEVEKSVKEIMTAPPVKEEAATH